MGTVIVEAEAQDAVVTFAGEVQAEPGFDIINGDETGHVLVIARGHVERGFDPAVEVLDATS